MLYRSIPVVHQPVADLGSGQQSTPYLSKKMYYMLFSIRAMHTRLRSEARNYGVALLNLFPLCDLSDIFQSSQTPIFGSLAPNPRLQLFSAVYFSWLHASRAKWQENRGRKKSVGVCPLHLRSLPPRHVGIAESKIYSIIW